MAAPISDKAVFGNWLWRSAWPTIWQGARGGKSARMYIGHPRREAHGGRTCFGRVMAYLWTFDSSEDDMAGERTGDPAGS